MSPKLDPQKGISYRERERGRGGGESKSKIEVRLGPNLEQAQRISYVR
jgi:hypothetical protein